MLSLDLKTISIHTLHHFPQRRHKLKLDCKFPSTISLSHTHTWKIYVNNSLMPLKENFQPSLIIIYMKASSFFTLCTKVSRLCERCPIQQVISFRVWMRHPVLNFKKYHVKFHTKHLINTEGCMFHSQMKLVLKWRLGAKECLALVYCKVINYHTCSSFKYSELQQSFGFGVYSV